MVQKQFKSLLYEKSDDDKVATIILNQFNAIDTNLLQDIRSAIRLANSDNDVHCIVIKGNGHRFCGGYDLKIWAEDARRGATGGSRDVREGYDTPPGLCHDEGKCRMIRRALS